jgi:hypothetical protein
MKKKNKYIYTTQLTKDLKLTHYRDVIVDYSYFPNDIGLFYQDTIRFKKIMAYVYKQNENDDYTKSFFHHDLNKIQENDNGTLYIKYFSATDNLRDEKIYYTNIILSCMLDKKEREYEEIRKRQLIMKNNIGIIKQLVEENNEDTRL